MNHANSPLVPVTYHANAHAFKAYDVARALHVTDRAKSFSSHDLIPKRLLARFLCLLEEGCAYNRHAMPSMYMGFLGVGTGGGSLGTKLLTTREIKSF